MRWRIQLSYSGTRYCGWQRQPDDPSVQQTIEEAFALILRQQVEIVGCGRTDSGVHARQYVAHADVADIALNDKIVYQLNMVLPMDIAIHSIEETTPEFHARFDAVSRQYKYYLHHHKDPFLDGRSWYVHQHAPLDHQAMHEAAALLMHYDQFQPFCKTGSDADHYKCKLSASHWVFDEHQSVYIISANRFLRGMVRLVVGACMNVGLGKITIADLKLSLDQQILLPHAWSVPGEGLYLEGVEYVG